MNRNTYRFRMYVNQSPECRSIEDALGAVRRHLERLGVHSYTFTLASLNDRAGRVTVTLRTSYAGIAQEFAAVQIEQDYPEEKSFETT